MKVKAIVIVIATALGSNEVVMMIASTGITRYLVRAAYNYFFNIKCVVAMIKYIVVLKN